MTAKGDSKSRRKGQRDNGRGWDLRTRLRRKGQRDDGRGWDLESRRESEYRPQSFFFLPFSRLGERKDEKKSQHIFSLSCSYFHFNFSFLSNQKAKKYFCTSFLSIFLKPNTDIQGKIWHENPNIYVIRCLSSQPSPYAGIIKKMN